MYEIERKFFIDVPLAKVIEEASSKVLIEQRYLLGDTGDWAIRVRKTTHFAYTQYFMTLKRKINLTKCVEIENEIEQPLYDSLATQCGRPLHKTRHHVNVGQHLWEVDEFHDLDLVIAEIELSDEEELFVRPHWLGKEITGKKKYTNKNLARFLDNIEITGTTIV